MSGPPTDDFLRYRRDAPLRTDFLQARFSGPAFERHAHETFAFGLTLHGHQCFTQRGVRHTSTAGCLITLNPEDLHDGEAGSDDGFSYWMMYPDVGVIEAILEDAGAASKVPFFADAVRHDPSLAALFEAVFRLLDARAGATNPPRESLATESLFELAMLGLAARHGRSSRSAGASVDTDTRTVERIRSILRDAYWQDIRLSDLARETGLSRFSINRLFTRATGVPPHRYLTMVRLERARDLLAEGNPPADVAASVGLADQSHLNRRFKNAYGVTPRQFQIERRRR